MFDKSIEILLLQSFYLTRLIINQSNIVLFAPPLVSTNFDKMFNPNNKLSRAANDIRH